MDDAGLAAAATPTTANPDPATGGGHANPSHSPRPPAVKMFTSTLVTTFNVDVTAPAGYAGPRG